MVEGEVGPLESPVLALRLVDDWDVRRDPALVDQPGEVFGRAVGAVGRQPPRATGRSGPGCARSMVRAAPTSAWRIARLASTSTMTAVVQVDRVVRGVGEEGVALVGAGPLGGGVGAGDELRLHLAGGAPGRVVERVEVLPDRAARRRHAFPVDVFGGGGRALACWRRLLIRLASVAKPSPPTSPSAMQRATGRLEQRA